MQSVGIDYCAEK